MSLTYKQMISFSKPVRTTDAPKPKKSVLTKKRLLKERKDQLDYQRELNMIEKEFI